MRLRDNLAARAGAWVLFLALVCGAALMGQKAAISLMYQDYDSVEDTAAFSDLLSDQGDWVRQYICDWVKLGDQSLDYVDRQSYADQLKSVEAHLEPSATNFRYQLLREDGSEVIDTNVDQESLDLAGAESLSGTDLVMSVHYGVLTVRSDDVVLDMDVAGRSYTFGYASAESETAGAELDAAAAKATHEIDGTEIFTVGERYILLCGVLKPDLMVAGDEFFALQQIYTQYRVNFQFYTALALALGAAAGLVFLFLLWASGHKPGEEGIVLAWPDRIFTEVWLLATAGAAFLALLCLLWYLNRADYWFLVEPGGLGMKLLLAAGTAWAAVCAGWAGMLLRTLVVRGKARALARTTLLCRAGKFLGQALAEFFKNLPFTWRAALVFLAYLLASYGPIILLRDFNPLLWFPVNLAALLGLCWWAAGFWRVREGTEVIAAGNLNHQIDTARLPGDLRSHAEALNNISGGLTNAVNEQMKSERFKAELITNVSHDLKTPLTSIINYVNLLKTTDQTDEKAREYIEVLDRKSLRLKKLTEDLVEASKASTGALNVNREKIGMVQLLDQALGEYEEKLEERKLAVVRSVPEEECFVYADGRHVWRVIDNLLANCAKYAMGGTRVYLDLTRGKGTVSLAVKNISREPLNIPPDRLMERFVRGEESRTTEGSGLGLSIAKSLTELQGGTFELAVDGDLFKAIVTLPQAS